MSYVNSVLVPGETIVAQATTHWWIYGWAILFFVLGVPPLFFAPPLAVVLFLIAAAFFIKAFSFAARRWLPSSPRAAEPSGRGRVVLPIRIADCAGLRCSSC